MLEWLSTLAIQFTARLSLSWSNSPNSKATAKSEQGHSIATSGAKSPVYVAGGNQTITHSTSQRTAVQDEDSWRELLKAFTPETTERISTNLLDPKLVKSQKDGIHLKDWIAKKFDAIALPSTDPRAKDLIILRDKAIKAIKILADEHDQSNFQKDWQIVEIGLQRLKDS